MLHKKLLITLLVFAAAGSAAALLPSESNGGAKAPRTIGLITGNGAEGFVGRFETGGRSAATALGDHLAIIRAQRYADADQHDQVAGRTARSRDRDPQRRP